MPRRLRPLPLKTRLRANRSGQKIGAPVKPRRTIEVQYRRRLLAIVGAVSAQFSNQLYGVIREGDLDLKVPILAQSLDQIAKSVRDDEEAAFQLAEQMVDVTNQQNTAAFQKSIDDATGVDLARIIAAEDLTGVLQASVAENVGLITDLPTKLIADVNRAVMSNVTTSTSGTGLIRQIQAITKKARNRAKLIARDQTAKVNAAITQARQEQLGITEYVWQTSEDERVRDSHRAKNGKTFKWSSPPKDTGHPGHDVNCRCIARPVIKF